MFQQNYHFNLTCYGSAYRLYPLLVLAPASSTCPSLHRALDGELGNAAGLATSCLRVTIRWLPPQGDEGDVIYLACTFTHQFHLFSQIILWCDFRFCVHNRVYDGGPFSRPQLPYFVTIFKRSLPF